MMRDLSIQLFYVCALVVIPVGSLALLKLCWRYLRGGSGWQVVSVDAEPIKVEPVEPEAEPYPSEVIQEPDPRPTLPVQKIEPKPEPPIECGNCGQVIESKPIGSTQAKPGDLQILQIYRCEHCGAKVKV